MNLLDLLKKPSIVLFIVVLIGCIALSVLAYRTTIIGGRLQPSPAAQKPTHVATPTSGGSATSTSTALQGLTILPVESPSAVLGVDANNPAYAYPGVPWVRLGYTSCGSGNLQGATLRSVIQKYHSQGIRVLLTYCQRGNNSSLYNTTPLNDIAHANADAVQCGNEEMKQDVAAVSFLYVPPDRFARFYDMCEQAVHAVRPNIPVLLGSLDPHVGGVDYQPLVDQANYLDQMQTAMNTIVHPGGNWDWHTQTLGLIDSWHNGYPNASVNSLYGLFQFWATQFQVDLNSGQLGQHLWVVEGTGCFTTGCGLDPNNAYQVAVSHVLTLITDVQTAMRYKVPFFYFSGLDFHDQGMYWPIGLMTPNGKPKPIRQDLPMGARTLTLSCSGKSVVVEDQVQLLARLYAHCTLPSNYVSILSS